MKLAGRSRWWLGVVAIPACTLTHSLDDLRGGSIAGPGTAAAGKSSMAGNGGSGGGGGNASGGSSATAGEPFVTDAGAGGETAAAGPHLISTGAAEHADKQGFLEPLELQFNDLIDVTTLVGSALCGKGTIRLSKVGDDLCVALGDATPVAGRPGRYSLTPTAPLEVGSLYTLLVTHDVKTEGGTPLLADDTSTLTAVYRHTIKIDGNNDFLPGEELATSTPGYAAYLAWDADALYLGMAGAQIQELDKNAGLFWLTYVAWPGIPGGTTVGQTYKAVSPTLDFAAARYVRWKGDNSSASLFSWTNESKWLETPFDKIKAKYQQTGAFVELRVPLEAGATDGTDPVKLVTFLLNETTGAESTYATAPASLSGGATSPQFQKHFELLLVDSLLFPKDYPSVH